MTWLGRLGAPLLIAASAFAVVTPDPAPPADAVATGLADVRVAHVDSPVVRVARVHVGAPDFDPTSALLKAQAEVIAARHDWERQKTLYAACGVRADLDAAAQRLRDALAKREAMVAAGSER